LSLGLNPSLELMTSRQGTGAPSENELASATAAPVAISPAKARALLFGTLAMLWIFPSLGALWILATDAKRWTKTSFGALIGSAAVEDWVAVALLATHVVFIWLAFRYKAKANTDPVAASPVVKTGGVRR
jgi:hypothetical protein